MSDIATFPAMSGSPRPDPERVPALFLLLRHIQVNSAIVQDVEAGFAAVRLEVVQGAVESADRFLKRYAHTAAATVATCLSLPAEVRVAARDVVTWLTKVQEPPFAVIGQLISSLMDAALHLVDSAASLTSLLIEAGYPVERAAELPAVREQLLALRANIMGDWPWPPTPEEVAQARAEHEQGACLSLEDAFAEMAGTVKEEWLERVTEHKRAKSQGQV